MITPTTTDGTPRATLPCPDCARSTSGRCGRHPATFIDARGVVLDGAARIGHVSSSIVVPR